MEIGSSTHGTDLEANVAVLNKRKQIEEAEGQAAVKLIQAAGEVPTPGNDDLGKNVDVLA